MAWKEVATYVDVSGNLDAYYDVLGNFIDDTPANDVVSANLANTVPLDPSKFVADWGMPEGSTWVGVGKGGSLNWGYDSTHEFTITRNLGGGQAISFTSGCNNSAVFENTGVQLGNYDSWYEWVVADHANPSGNPTNTDIDQGHFAPYGGTAATSAFARPVLRKLGPDTEPGKRGSSPWRLAEFNADGIAANTSQDSSFCHSYTENGTPAFWMGMSSDQMGNATSGNGMYAATRFDGGHFLISGNPTNIGGASLGPEIGWRYYDKNNWGPFITSNTDSTANHQHENKYLPVSAPASQIERITSSHTFASDGIEGDVFLGPNQFVETFTDTSGNTWAVYSFFRTKHSDGTVYDLMDSSADTPAELKNIMHTTDGGSSAAAPVGATNGLGFPGGKRVKIWDTAAETALTQAYSKNGQYHAEAENIVATLAEHAANGNQHFTLTSSGTLDEKTGLYETYTFTSGYAYPYFYDNNTQNYLEGAPTTNLTEVWYGYDTSTNGNNLAHDTQWAANGSWEGGPTQLATTGAGKNQWLVMGRYFLVMVRNADGDTGDTLPNGFDEAHYHSAMEKVTFKISNLYRSKVEGCASTLGGLTVTGNVRMVVAPSLANVEEDLGANSVTYGQTVMTTVSDTLSGLGETSNLGPHGGETSPAIEIMNNTQGGINAKMFLDLTDAMDEDFGVQFKGGVGGSNVYQNTTLTATTYTQSGMINGTQVTDIVDELENLRIRYNSDNVDSSAFKTIMEASESTDTWRPDSGKLNQYFDQTTKGADVLVVKGDSVNIGTISAPVAGDPIQDAKIFIHIDQTVSGGE